MDQIELLSCFVTVFFIYPVPILQMINKWIYNFHTLLHSLSFPLFTLSSLSLVTILSIFFSAHFIISRCCKSFFDISNVEFSRFISVILFRCICYPPFPLLVFLLFTIFVLVVLIFYVQYVSYIWLFFLIPRIGLAFTSIFSYRHFLPSRPLIIFSAPFCSRYLYFLKKIYLIVLGTTSLLLRFLMFLSFMFPVSWVAWVECW